MSHPALTDDAQLDPWWWEAAPPVKIEHLPLPQQVDVAIIGAGYTGTTAALALAKAGRSVLLIEAQDPGFGASSRNGGMIGSGHRVAFRDVIREYGEHAADEIMREGLRSLDYATGLIEEENIDCDFVRCGRFRGAWTQAHYDTMAKEVELLHRKTGAPVHVVPRAEQGREVAVEHYHGGCVYEAHGGLHPAKFYRGIFESAVKAGVQVSSRTQVHAVRRDGTGYSLQTSRGFVSAGDVIVATNGYTGHATPTLRKKIIPIASYMIATEPLGKDRVKALIPGGRMIVETRSQHCYYRPSPDGERILLGGRAALGHIDTARSAVTLRKLLVGLFPSLEDMLVSHSWLGTLGFSKDHLPHIGRTPDGLHYAVGYSGSGVAMAPYLGYRVANKVLGTSEGDTGFDTIKHPGVFLREFVPLGLPMVNMWYRLKDMKEGS